MANAHTAHSRSAGHLAWLELISNEERIASATPDEVEPLFQGMMRGGCKGCPAAQARVCQNLEKPFGVLGHEFVSQWKTMPWQFKAEDVLAGGASDASVSHEDVRAVMHAIEDLARSRGHDHVSMGDLTEGFHSLITSYTYQAPAQDEPGFDTAVAAMGAPSPVIARGKHDSRRRAGAFRADANAVAINKAEIVHSLPQEMRVHEALEARPLNWCNHLPHLWSRMLSRVEMSDEEFDDALSLAEAVAVERQHPGVTPRDAETALMRAASRGLRSQPSEGGK